MVDRISPQARSRIMAAIRSVDTQPELLLRKALFARGYRYRVHNKSLAGSPDITLPKWGAVIFVHGCFWHAHSCGNVRLPKSNRAFWKRKFTRNMARDQTARDGLLKRGWRVLTVWDCAFKGKTAQQVDMLADRVEAWLLGGRRSGVLQSRRRR
jgi:DNA mismatch endonuclease (patch repair protein)